MPEAEIIIMVFAFQVLEIVKYREVSRNIYDTTTNYLWGYMKFEGSKLNFEKGCK